MKALLCGECGDFKALHPDPDTWRQCRCGNLAAHWVDPDRGIAEFHARNPRRAFGLGLNNQLLMPAIEGKLSVFQDFREAHERATTAPGYVFDKSRAGCWAVVFKPGATNDTSFASERPTFDGVVGA